MSSGRARTTKNTTKKITKDTDKSENLTENIEILKIILEVFASIVNGMQPKKNEEFIEYIKRFCYIIYLYHNDIAKFKEKFENIYKEITKLRNEQSASSNSGSSTYSKKTREKRGELDGLIKGKLQYEELSQHSSFKSFNLVNFFQEHFKKDGKYDRIKKRGFLYLIKLTPYIILLTKLDDYYVIDKNNIEVLKDAIKFFAINIKPNIDKFLIDEYATEYIELNKLIYGLEKKVVDKIETFQKGSPLSSSPLRQVLFKEYKVAIENVISKETNTTGKYSNYMITAYDILIKYLNVKYFPVIEVVRDMSIATTPAEEEATSAPVETAASASASASAATGAAAAAKELAEEAAPAPLPAPPPAVTASANTAPSPAVIAPAPPPPPPPPPPPAPSPAPSPAPAPLPAPPPAVTASAPVETATEEAPASAEETPAPAEEAAEIADKAPAPASAASAASAEETAVRALFNKQVTPSPPSPQSSPRSLIAEIAEEEEPQSYTIRQVTNIPVGALNTLPRKEEEAAAEQAAPEEATDTAEEAADIKPETKPKLPYNEEELKQKYLYTQKYKDGIDDAKLKELLELKNENSDNLYNDQSSNNKIVQLASYIDIFNNKRISDDAATSEDYKDIIAKIRGFENDPKNPLEALEIKFEDRLVFIIATFFIRYVAISMIQRGIDINLITTFYDGFIYYGCIYLVLFWFVVLFINIDDKYTTKYIDTSGFINYIRSLFYYFYMGTNGISRLLIHSLLLIVIIIIPIILNIKNKNNININDDTKDTEDTAPIVMLTLEERTKLSKLLSVFTLFIWILTSIIATKF
jgi:hypothetical protein